MSKMLKVVGASWLQTKISSYILGFLGVLAIMALLLGLMDRIQEDGTYAATVFYSSKTGYRIEYWGQSNELADIQRGVARAYFRTDIDTNGWSTIEVETDPSYPDEIQAYAAGVVEGALTWSLIHSHLENTVRAKCRNIETQCNTLRDALQKAATIWKNYPAKYEKTEPFWHQVSLYYTQIEGIFKGWEHGVARSQNEYETDISDLFWLNAVGELTEIQHKLNITILDPTTEDLPTPSSSFIKLVKEIGGDGNAVHTLLTAHNAAGSYNTMTKILKRYKLGYHLTADPDSEPVPVTSVEFPGYPGSVTSQDEFYSVRGNGVNMAILGTPIRNYNSKLWKEVNITSQVPLGPRVTSANRLSTTPSTWVHTVARSNSGTGCKQWLLADLARFDSLSRDNVLDHYVPNELPLADVVTENVNDVRHTVVHRGGGGGRARGLLLLLEQIPARTHSADISDTLLERSYCFTHGLPVFKDITEATNTTGMQESHGAIFSEAQSPRALTFQRGHKNATSLNSVIRLMRSVNMTAMDRASEDCVGRCQLMKVWSELGVRGDMGHGIQLPYGVIDTAVIRYIANSQTPNFVAVAGPPFTELPKNNSTHNVLTNKGNIAALYTDRLREKIEMERLQSRELYRHARDETPEERQNIIKPFQWSESPFLEQEHKGLPDKWAFDPFEVIWSW